MSKFNPRVTFELQGELSALRNAMALGTQLPFRQDRIIATLRRSLPVAARRDIQAEYNIRPDRVYQDLRVTSSDDGLTVTGRWDRGVGLINFSARQNKRGVSAAVFKGRRTLAPGAFKATLRGGGEHVVERFGPKTHLRTYTDKKGKQRKRLTQRIAPLYGATVAQMLSKGRRPERIVDFARGVVGKEIARLRRDFEKGQL